MNTWPETIVAVLGVVAIGMGVGSALAFAELLVALIQGVLDHYRDWRFRRRWVRRAPRWRRVLNVQFGRLGWRS